MFRPVLETTSKGIPTNNTNEVEMAEDVQPIERRRCGLDTPKEQPERSMANCFG